QYAPGTPHGDRVLAHELVHVGQRQDGRMASGGGVAAHDDPLEREAYGAEQEIARIAQETRSDASESAGPDRAASGERASATTEARSGPNVTDSAYATRATHAARTGPSPIHRESAEGEGQGTG